MNLSLANFWQDLLLKYIILEIYCLARYTMVSLKSLIWAMPQSSALDNHTARYDLWLNHSVVLINNPINVWHIDLVYMLMNFLYFDVCLNSYCKYILCVINWPQSRRRASVLFVSTLLCAHSPHRKPTVWAVRAQ